MWHAELSSTPGVLSMQHDASSQAHHIIGTNACFLRIVHTAQPGACGCILTGLLTSALATAQGTVETPAVAGMT
jgi:hypothetical protein